MRKYPQSDSQNGLKPPNRQTIIGPLWLSACLATDLEISTKKPFALFVNRHKALCYLLTLDGVCVWLMAVQQHAVVEAILPHGVAHVVL